MPDIPISFGRPISGDCREGTTDSSVTPGIVLAALLAVLFLFGPRVFDGVKNAADMSTPQANTEALTTGETKTPFDDGRGKAIGEQLCQAAGDVR